MNIRFGDGEVRFRISAEELESLRKGGAVQETVRIGSEALNFEIGPCGDSRDLTAHLRLGVVRLCVPPDKLEALADMGRSREGLACRADGTVLRLQVDVRAYKPRPEERRHQAS